MSFRLVIFDLGGVLVRREPRKAIERIARETGKPIEMCEQILGDRKLIEAFELGQVSPKQFFERVRAPLGLGWSFEQFASAWNSILTENTDTTWILQRLRSRYRLAVISNTNVLHDEYIRRTWPVFEQLHDWIVSYQVGMLKPDPRIYQLVLTRLDIPPRSAVFIDDLFEHVDVARRLGLTGIHFTDGLELERELRAVGLHV